MKITDEHGTPLDTTGIPAPTSAPKARTVDELLTATKAFLRAKAKFEKATHAAEECRIAMEAAREVMAKRAGASS